MQEIQQLSPVKGFTILGGFSTMVDFLKVNALNRGTLPRASETVVVCQVKRW
jgi:hypothetical protein